MRRAESGASLSNKAPAVGGAVNAFLHSGCEYGASVVWSWLFLLCFFSLSFAQRRILLLFEIEKNVAFFYPQNSGIKKHTASSFSAWFTLSKLSSRFRFLLLSCSRAFVWTIISSRRVRREREREREREGKRERLFLLVSFYLVS